MAGEKFPDVKPGQPITADRANREAAVLERWAAFLPSSNLSGEQSNSRVNIVGMFPAVLAVLKVTEDLGSSVYKGVLRRYSFQTNAWTDGTKEWRIDAGATESELDVSQLVVCYYDRKRGAFIPANPNEVRFRVFELKTSLPYGGLATAYVRYSTAPAIDITDTTQTIIVWDYIGDRRGTGRDDNEDGSRGAIGLAMQLPGETTVWRVIDLECYFPPVEALSSSSSGDVSSVSSASSLSSASSGSSASSMSSGSESSSGSSASSASSGSESSSYSSYSSTLSQSSASSESSELACEPCDGYCWWHCNNGVWSIISEGCQQDYGKPCYCVPPGIYYLNDPRGDCTYEHYEVTGCCYEEQESESSASSGSLSSASSQSEQSESSASSPSSLSSASSPSSLSSLSQSSASSVSISSQSSVSSGGSYASSVSISSQSSVSSGGSYAS